MDGRGRESWRIVERYNGIKHAVTGRVRGYEADNIWKSVSFLFHRKNFAELKEEGVS